jgi:hypothetical protein
MTIDTLLNFIMILIIVFVFNYFGQKFLNTSKINWPIFILFILIQSLVITLLLMVI